MTKPVVAGNPHGDGPEALRPGVGSGRLSVEVMKVAGGDEIPGPGLIPLPVHGALAASNAPVILVCAPAGFGKTALMRGAKADRDRSDLDSIWLESSSGGDTNALFVPCNRGARVFFDNADDMPARVLRDLIDEQCRSRPVEALVIAFRGPPPPDILARELAGDILVLRATDLALTAGQTGLFLQKYGHADVRAELVHDIHKTTEGWPIAVRIYAHAIARFGDPVAPGLKVAASLQISEYVRTVHLASLSDKERALLQGLAQLDQFNAALVRAALGAEAAELMREASVSSILWPARQRELWQRLPGPVRDALLLEAGDKGSVRTRSVLENASRWCEAQGYVEDAIEYALRADLLDDAERLLLDNVNRIVSQSGAIPAVEQWVLRLQRRKADTAVHLKLWRAWALVFMLRVEEAETELSDALGIDLGPDDLALLQRVKVSIASRKLDQIVVSTEAYNWLASWERSEPFQAAAVAVAQSLASYQCFEDGQQRRSLQAAMGYAKNAASPYAQAGVLAVEGLIELNRGRAYLAAELLERAREIAVYKQVEALVGTIALIRARVDMELGNSDAAKRHFSEGYPSIADHNLIETYIAGIETATWLAMEEKGIDGAMAELRTIGADHDPRLAIQARLLATHFLISVKDVARARNEFALARAIHQGRRGTNIPGPATEQDHSLRHCEAWLLFAEGRSEEARALIAPLVPHADAHDRGRRFVSLQMLSGAIELARGDQGAADRAIWRAMRTAKAGGLVHTVVRHGWAVRPLVASYLNRQQPDAYSEFCEKIAASLGLCVDGEDGASDPPLAVQLTAREKEILGLMDSGRPVTEISSELALSNATIKWHIRNIYDKLGVRNRSGAVALARKMGLID